MLLCRTKFKGKYHLQEFEITESSHVFRYHIKYGKVPQEIVSSKKELNHSSLHKFSGLLHAYDEILEERDAIIK